MVKRQKMNGIFAQRRSDAGETIFLSGFAGK
jgi:hypothetical protein